MLSCIATVGVYGFTEDEFFRTLRRAEVDTFIDVRLRRGMRGSQYAFVNSARLQLRLAKEGISYQHEKALAPPTELRAVQKLADAETATAKRDRLSLAPSFVSVYRDTVLAELDSQKFVAGLPSHARVVTLFCVERDPRACHRSLIAERLSKDLSVPILDLVP